MDRCFLIGVWLSLLSACSPDLVVRRPRQTQCLSYTEFTCASGECISRYKVCDGRAECSDGSDETATACKQVHITSCAPAFQCTYGACVIQRARCNGKNDCADGSDEIGCPNSVPAAVNTQPLTLTANSNCTGGGRCTNGQCIDRYDVCDGVFHCDDRSDETEQVCYNLFKGQCSSEYFRCKYGACLHHSVRCNGRRDCWDGSDEAVEAGCRNSNPVEVTSPTTNPPVATTVVTTRPGSQPTGKPCVVPVEADNRRFAVFKCQYNGCALSPGQEMSDQSLIIATCDAGHQLSQFKSLFVTSCTDGRWFPEIPKCDKLCPNLKSETLQLLCWQPEEGCDKPMLPGTRVDYKCKEFYQNNALIASTGEIKCLPSGEWSGSLPECNPACGQSSLDQKYHPLIVDGTASKLGNFPWHVALFQRRQTKWVASCGGTLVTTRHVLTAAHCVTVKDSGIQPPPLDKNDLMVVAGKLYREYNASTSSEVRVAVEAVRVHTNYKGAPQRYAQDIAVLVLVKVVPVSSFIMPACIDFDLKWEKDIFSSNIKGYIAGWGNTQECSSFGNVCNSPSDELKHTQVNVMNNSECYRATQLLRPAFPSTLSDDKICAGDGTISLIQQGGSGGGLTFDFHGNHFVYGVMSIKLQVQGSKQLHSFSAFTSIAYHIPWLRKQLD